MSLSGSKVISRPPGRASRPVSLTLATSGSAATGSTVSGCSPVSPSTTAFTLPWPCPVAPSEPNSSTRSPATRGVRPSVASVSVNIPAARIGPTVCELDGPIPILNSSKALIAMARLLSAAPRRCGATSSPCDAGATLGATPYPLPYRVERRAQRNRHRLDLTAHVHLVRTGAHELRCHRVARRIPDVGQPGRGAERGTPGSRGDLAHGHAVTQHKLAAPHHRARVAGDQGHQPPPGALGPCLLHRFPAEEADVGAQLASEPQPGLHRPVVRGQ